MHINGIPTTVSTNIRSLECVGVTTPLELRIDPLVAIVIVLEARQQTGMQVPKNWLQTWMQALIIASELQPSRCILYLHQN